MRISVIIPVFNEAKTIAQTLQAVARLGPHEIIVVDGGSTDDTAARARQTGVTVISSPRGRARQMNHGAKLASGDVLLFLHSDTYLPSSALTEIAAAMTHPHCPGGRFDLRLDREERIYRIIGALISLRSRLTKVATGDQAIFVRREIFESMRGFPDIPLMEDIAFSRLLKRQGKVACLRSRVVTSARRWEKEGVWQTILKMWVLKLLYFTGVSPVRLKHFYDDTR
ncbi:MAG: TIGR04283 family arsenosugar biosynthesis glycosyltransferase [Deltaproteobacteria bacterium]|nr:TIGR04283 family arsenosugar biosynthesis glycosyltransferase [Deltaproteobacteria bacterium]